MAYRKQVILLAFESHRLIVHLATVPSVLVVCASASVRSLIPVHCKLTTAALLQINMYPRSECINTVELYEVIVVKCVNGRKVTYILISMPLKYVKDILSPRSPSLKISEHYVKK